MELKNNPVNYKKTVKEQMIQTFPVQRNKNPANKKMLQLSRTFNDDTISGLNEMESQRGMPCFLVFSALLALLMDNYGYLAQQNRSILIGVYKNENRMPEKRGKGLAALVIEIHEYMTVRQLLAEVKESFADTAKEPAGQLPFPRVTLLRMNSGDRMKCCKNQHKSRHKMAFTLVGPKGKPPTCIHLDYDNQLFNESYAQQILNHLLYLLDLICRPENWNFPVKQLDMLNDSEKNILNQFNNTDTPYPHKTVGQLFAESVRKYPDRAALGFNDLWLSYNELDRRSEQIASYLYEGRKLQPGEPAGIFMDKSVNLAIAILGILKAGGTYVPIEPTFPYERIKLMIKDTAMRVILSSRRHVGVLNRLQWECPEFDCFLCLDSFNIYEEEETDKNISMNRELWIHVGETAKDDIAAGGWLSSYTGKPFSQKEMLEFRENVYEKVKPLLQKGSRVLEIGCASGFSMFRIAPEVGLYYGTDLSPVIIMKNQLRVLEEGLENIKLKCVAAHQIHQIDEKNFDLVIINSVVQCFHGHNYLRKIIEKVLLLVSNQGTIFLGDLMDTDLKDELQNDLLRFKQENNTSTANYTTKTDISSELFVSRGFLRDLCVEFPMIRDVAFSHKIHTVKNELTEFRYDALLKVDKTSIPSDYSRSAIKRKYQEDRRALATFPLPHRHAIKPPGIDSGAYIIYTSGSTGQPKGVVVPHRGLASLTTVFKETVRAGPNDRIVQFASPCFDSSVWEIFMAFFSGATLCMVTGESVNDPQKFSDFIESRSITIAACPPNYLKLMDNHSLSPLRFLITAGSAAGVEMVETWRKRLQYVNGYGPTENTICATLWPAPSDGTSIKQVPIGSPINNVKIYIMSHGLRLQPPGVPGELCISGASLAGGYLNRPDLTAAQFPRRQPSNQPIYRTGDLACWLPAGTLEFLGRIDFQVKIRGFRVEPGEIEKRMLHCEGITDAVVIAREDELGESYLCAYYIETDKEEGTPGTSAQTLGTSTWTHGIREFLAEQLPAYMIPSYILKIDFIPVTISGKVDRKRLPDPRTQGRSDSYSPPVTLVQKKLAAMWSEILGMDAAVIGIHDNFFRLGGHSLKAASMITAIHKDLNVKVPIREIFKSPSIYYLGLYIENAGKENYSAVSAVEKREYYNQSSAQKRLYIMQMMARESTGYNVQLLDVQYQLTGKKFLEAAFKSLIRRHESLRTSFSMVDGEAVQVVHDDVPFEIEFSQSSEGRIPSKVRRQGPRDRRADLSRPDDTIRRKEGGNRRGERNTVNLTSVGNHHELTGKDIPVYKIVKNFVRPFDLSRAPLMRVGVINIRKSRQVLMVDMHHIICDGVSIKIFLNDLKAILAGVFLPRLTLQYKDFSHWAGNETNSSVMQAQEKYWLDQFSGNLPLLDLPFDYQVSNKSRYRGNTVLFELNSDETRRLHLLSRAQGCTLYIVLLAAYNVLLARLSGQQDIIVGSATAGRKHEEIQQIIGIFVNTMALRNFPAMEKSIGDFLSEVKERTLTAFDNQDYPFEKLVSHTLTRRDSSRHPLFDVAFVLQNQAEKSGQMPDVMVPGKSKPYHYELNQAKFMLTLMGVETETGIQFSLEHNRKQFKVQTVRRFTGYFKRIINGFCDYSGSLLGEINLLSHEEKEELIYDFNNTGVAFPDQQTIHGMFRLQVEKSPDRICLMGPGMSVGTRETSTQTPETSTRTPGMVTYGELNRRANGMAGLLQLRGIGSGSIVAVMAQRSIEMIIGIMGALKSGAAYLPIDPGYPGERINYMLMDSQAGALVSDVELVKEVGIKTDKLVELPEFDPCLNFSPPLSPVASSDLAYIIYTSGTTGWPKGVAVEHQGVVSMLLHQQDAFNIDSSVVDMQLFSFSFDGFVISLFTPLISGARTLLVSEADLKDINILRTVMVNHGVTYFISVPALFSALLDELSPGDTGTLRSVMLAGDNLPLSILEMAREKNPNLEIAHAYGVTEFSVMSTLYRHQEQEAVIKIGAPIWNQSIFILNRGNKLQPLGVPGELCIGGTGIARGYLNRPELTAERFPQNCHKFGANENPGDFTASAHRLYRTGDLARWLVGGIIEFLGRIDHQVKIKGFRIETGEIEKRMTRHPGIKEAVVMARSDTHNQKYLCAYYVNNMNYTPHPHRPELWPSIAEFFVYDKLINYAMTNDQLRNNSFKPAINKLVKGKVVLEIGTGQDAILARFCIDAGAQKVYAYEMMDENFKMARRKIKELGLEDKIMVIYGDATRLDVPEKADVCISAIIGSIGGAQGAAVVANNARKFLKEDARVIPARSVTKIAAVHLPVEIHENPAFTGVPGKYTEKIFHRTGYLFDLRLCVRNFPVSNLVSNAENFEQLDFSGPIAEEGSGPLNFTINRDAVIDGFLVWLTLDTGISVSPDTGPGKIIDTLDSKYSWLPVYVPVFYPGVEVKEGDLIETILTRSISENLVNPDYRLKGVLKRQFAEDIPFDYNMPYVQQTFRGTPFYKKLFKNKRINYLENGNYGPNAAELRDYLGKRLAPHMIPSYFVRLKEMPLTPNGKIDRKAFADPKLDNVKNRGTYEAPQNQVQQLMVDIWQQVLGVDRIGITDDFFLIGGDSIKTLQVISRLRKNQLLLDANRLFTHKNIKRVSTYLKPLSEPHNRSHIKDQDIIEGVVPLTPIQYWLFNEHRRTADRLTQSVLLTRRGGFAEEDLRETLSSIVSHHDALRMVYRISGDMVEQENRPIREPLYHMEVRYLPVNAGKKQINGLIRQETLKMQQGFNLTDGPLLRASLIRSGQQDDLVLMIHHLVVDGVSWRILLDDIQVGYTQASARKRIVLPDKTASFKRWSKALIHYARSRALIKQLPYWRYIDSSPIPELPVDYNLVGRKRKFEDYKKLSFSLSTRDTCRLESEVHRAFNTEINDLLLTAAAMAVAGWANVTETAFDLEGHGREPIGGGMDISRTVGWFTSQFPVVISVPAQQDMVSHIKHVKEMLRKIPVKGVGYGILKYVTAPAKRGPLKFKLRPEISFNYLGRFEGSRQSDKVPFSTSMNLTSGPDAAFENHYNFNIEGLIDKGKLRFSIYYHKYQYKQENAARLTGIFEEMLKAVIQVCLAQEESQKTPSDLGYSRLTVDRLPLLSGMVKRLLGNDTHITTIYPLTPLQNMMLKATQANKESYFIQNVMTIPAGTRQHLLEKSFDLLRQQFPVLRTLFSANIFGVNDAAHHEAAQIVYRKKNYGTVIPLIDLSDMDEEEKKNRMAQVKEEDFQQGFDFCSLEGPTCDPVQSFGYMRLKRIKTGSDRDFLLWSLHHIMVDGWSFASICNQLINIYRQLAQGCSPLVLSVPSYRSFIDWQEDQELAAGKRHWENYLDGYSGGPGISIMADNKKKNRYKLEEFYFELGPEQSKNLAHYAGGYQVTLNTLFQTLWGRLLWIYTGRNDVLFSSVVSGRSAQLEEVEQLVGSLINVVPVRVNSSVTNDFPRLLKKMQRRAMHCRSFEALPLKLNDLLANHSLPPESIDSVMIFENYPEEDHNTHKGSKTESEPFTLKMKENREQWHYDFCFFVVPGESILIRFSYNGNLFSKDRIELIAGDFQKLAGNL